MIKAAEQLGFTAKGVKGNQEAFFSEFPLPAIAHVVVDGSLLHYVVIHKITKKKIIIADPAKDIVNYTPEEFFKIWTGVLIMLVPTSKFKKGNENQGILSRFFSLLLPQKRLLINIFLSSLMITIFGILASFYFRFIMDDIVPNSTRKTLIALSVGVIALYIFKAILEAFRNHLMLYLAQKLDIPFILGYYEHVLGLPMNFFGTRKVGEIVSRFTDASKIRDAISSATLTIMIDSLMAIVGGAVLYVQNSTLFVIAVIVVALYGVIVFAFKNPVKKINEKQMEDNAQVTSYLVETLNGIETVKAFHVEDKTQAKTDKLFVKLLKSVFKGGMIMNAQQTLTNIVSTIGGTIILWVGVVNVLNGNMTLGSLVTFNALLAYFLDPVKNLINLQPTMQTAIVAAERLAEILDLELEKTQNESRTLAPESLNLPIRIENLDFRYGTRRLVLENINMTINAGEKIALVGESGSGKTTLSKLLMNFYPWEKGEIFIGDYNLKDINLETLRNRIAYISQDIFLFSGTIKENLEYKEAYLSDLRSQILLIENQLISDSENPDLTNALAEYTRLRAAVEQDADFSSADETIQGSYTQYRTQYDALIADYAVKSEEYQNLYSTYMEQSKTVRVTEADIQIALTVYDNAAMDVETLKKTFISQVQAAIQSLNNDLKTLESNRDSLELSLKNVDNLEEYEKLSSDKLKNEAIITINSEIDSIKSNIASIESQLMEIEETIKNCEITATVDGTVTLINEANTGDIIQAGSSLCSIIPSGSKLKVTLYIPESDIAKVEVGQKTEYIIDSIPYGIENTGSAPMMEVEIMYPLDKPIAVSAPYVLKPVFRLRNAVKIRHTGNPALMQNAANELMAYIKDRGLMPITAGYNVTVQEPTSPTDIENLIVDMYVGVSDNIL